MYSVLSRAVSCMILISLNLKLIVNDFRSNERKLNTNIEMIGESGKHSKLLVIKNKNI